MITPLNGPALWAQRGLWPPVALGSMRGSPPQPDAVLIETLTNTLSRIQGYEHLGLEEEVRRELEALPPAVRELPLIQLRLGRALERLSCFEEAQELYDGMERSTLSRLGSVRCLARAGRVAEACELLDGIPFDASAVKEFVEARDLVR
jgi:hypothetical protein